MKIFISKKEFDRVAVGVHGTTFYENAILVIDGVEYPVNKYTMHTHKEEVGVNVSIEGEKMGLVPDCIVQL